MNVLPVSGARGSRRRYRNGRGTRLGGEHPLSLGPPNDGGVVWLGVIQRPDRLAFSRVYASVSTVLSARAFPRLSVVQGIAKLPCPHYLIGRERGPLGAPADLHHLPPGRTVTLAMCAWVCLTTYTHDFKGEPGGGGASLRGLSRALQREILVFIGTCLVTSLMYAPKGQATERS